MRTGANFPYDSRSRDETWRLFGALDPSEITISSHEPDEVYYRLLEDYPDILMHVRMKGNRAWWPGDVTSAEWGNERSLVDRCEWLSARGVTPYVILGNEPDIELAAEPVDNDGNRAHAADTYLRWCGRAIRDLRSALGGQVKLALAPLSQGNPDRYHYWLGQYRASHLLLQVDFWCEHAYTDGRPFDDPDWGGRPLADRPGNLPVHVTETNDNGRYATQDPHERAADFAGYAAFLRDSGAVESLSLFTLPGGAQDSSKPSWWLLTPEIVTAVREALQNPVQNIPESMPVPTPPSTEVPKVADINTLRAAQFSAIDPGIPFVPTNGIGTLWAQTPGAGSALTPEIVLDDGTVGQAFVNAIILWSAEKGAWVA